LWSAPIVNGAEVGVTRRQAWDNLTTLLEETRAQNPGLAKSPEFQGAVAKLSNRIKAASAGGGIYAQGEGGALREEFRYRGSDYRIDLENLKGHNLRE
jgi:hypothetical protein